MSVRGFLKDSMLFTLIIALIIISVWTLYNYFTTYETKWLIWGLIAAFVAVFATIARYRFLVDYVWTLVKHWGNKKVKF